jgi:hypothetical protein
LKFPNNSSGYLLKYKAASLAAMQNRISAVFVCALLAAALYSLMLPSGQAAGQVPGITMVTGTYTNEAAGVEITFPEGWEGAAIETEFGIIVSVAEGGMMSEESPSHMMGLMIMDKSEVESAPTDPSEFSMDGTSTCSTPSMSTVQVSGVAASQIIVECTESGVTSKSKMIVLETDTRWISAIFMAPVAEFDASVSAFDDAVSTLEVRGATDMEGGTGVNVGLQLRTQTVMLAGQSLQVDVRSSSTITEFRLDEETKTLTFKADGQTGTEGSTEIAVGKMLNGPYTVTIDGETTTDFEVDGTGAEAVMTISYTHSVHDIAVTGASVVPEFPVAAVGMIAALIGIVAVLGRTKLFSKGVP